MENVKLVNNFKKMGSETYLQSACTQNTHSKQNEQNMR